MPTENQDDFAPTEGLPTRSGLAGESPEGSLPPGARLGRYRIEALLGRGGMGEVYRAGQLEPVRRTVALKLLHARRVDARHLAYFEIERQLLAQMKHPAIAQVYDAGATPDGYPFFAMEFIEGSPLTTYCEQRALPLRERLELFIRVCEGVQHAHQKGVIHRDLKPGNILVAEVDGRPLPKIIDFGIATAASRSLAAGEHAGELERAGTPDYMSPEQAGLDGVEVDTRSDVYSLGVLLYELLAGRRPGIGAATTGEAHHTASTTVRPPSAQITELAPGNAAARAHQLGLSSPRLRRLLRRELDWVVLKAMRRDRAERYPSAAELAEELRRFLDDRPLQAVPHSRRYVAGKYLRRHRVAVAAASAVALAVLAGLGMSLYGLQQANQQRQIAERRSAELERVAAFQQSMLEGIDIEAMGLRLSTGLREQLQASAPEKLPLLEDLLASASAPDLARSLIDREILHRAEQAIDADFADQPRLAADLRLAVGKVQEALGVSGEAAATYARVAAHHESVGGESAPEALLARQMQAQALINADQLEPARTVNERLLALTEGAPAGDELRLDVESQQATLLFLAGERPKAREMQQALYDRERARRPADDRRLMALQADLGLAMARMGDIRQARAMYETLHAQASASLPEEDSFRLNVLGRLAVMRAMDGDVENAVELQRQRADISVRKLGAEHPQSLSERGNLANMLLDLRRFDEAEALMRSVLEARERNFGLDSASTLRSRLNLASLLIRRDRDSEEGLALEERVVAGRTRLLGPEHPDTLFIRINHAGSLRRAGHPAQALSEIRAAMPAARKVLGMKHPQAQAGLAIEADSLADLGRSREALPLQQEVLELRRQTFGDEGMETVMAAVALAERHEDVGDAAAARAVRARYVEPLLARPESELDAGERETVRRLREREADGEEGA